MRISDWSSDVCSSDLRDIVPQRQFGRRPRTDRIADDDDVPRLDARPAKPAHRRLAIAIEARLARRTRVPAIAPIFDQHQPVPPRPRPARPPAPPHNIDTQRAREGNSGYESEDH